MKRCSSAAGAAPAPARCSFFDESNLGGERQDTPACSNGGYIFVGLIDPTRVDQLLAKLLPLLTSAVGNLIASGAPAGGLAAKAPYQTKELYAEFMEYLTGGPSYNGKLDVYDNVLAKALPRDQTADVEQARAVIAAFADPANAGKGVLKVNGKMTELLHLAQARRMVAVAEAIAEREKMS